MDEQQDQARRTVLHMQSNLLQAIEGNEILTARHQAQVHKAIDLLRATRADGVLLQRAEAISCIMHLMPTFLRQGRVNAYASARLRLRSAACALGTAAW
jgi:hypothetical protein